jgi:hypothetical protein
MSKKERKEKKARALKHMAQLQIRKISCQTLGPASKRVLPDLSTFCQTYLFLEIF